MILQSRLQSRTPWRPGITTGHKKTREGACANTSLSQTQKTSSTRDQCNIFRLRTGHVNLNFHRNRIDPLFASMCRHCMYPYETVEHHLLHCDKLVELRKNLLPPNPSIENCMYSSAKQLRKTSEFHIVASRV